MKKFLLVLLLICWQTVFAAPLSGIVFFGDSLSDDGNLYGLLLRIIPKSPVYFKGRFSNGATWAEYVGKHYYDKYYIDYDNYAYGGATAIYHQPKSDFIAPTILSEEISRYTTDALGQDKSKILYSIWVGGNDYLFAQNEDANELTSKVINQIVKSIKVLIDEGARNFLILNLPDLSKIPFANTNGFNEKLFTMSTMHNQKLAEAIQSLQSAYPNAKFTYIDVFSMMLDVINNPEKYNQQYSVNITNTTDACWLGKFTYKNAITFSNINARVKNVILNSPELSYVYAQGNGQTVTPCANADEHIFWDKIHPSAVVHRILAQIVLQQLDKEYS